MWEALNRKIRDDAHAKIGGICSGQSGGLLIAMHASNQTFAPIGIPNDSNWGGHALVTSSHTAFSG